MTTTIPDPFAPVTLGPVTLRNRIIKAATSEGRSPKGLVTDDLIDFHLDFIRGGAGMTTVAYCCVSPEGASAPGQILMSEKSLPGLKRLTDAIHAEGGAISAQLGHAGMVASKKITGVTSMGPSKFVNPSSMEYCRAIRREEITMVIEQFGAAARITVEAGFDAVELHFGHNYLPSSFLSPLLNRRKDEYGGSIENRSRFVREIAQRVRAEVGDKIAVIAKISMDDGLPGSIWLNDSIRTAQLLDEDRNLDAIELTQGSSIIRQMYLFRGDVPVSDFAAVVKEPMKTGVRLFGKFALGSFPYKDLYMLDAARQFVPVMKHTKLILLGGINNREHIDTGMREGFDFVAMGRGLLREPDLVNRIREDSTVTSRCIHCNKCMYTVYGRTHCVLEPNDHHGAVPDRNSPYAVDRARLLPLSSVG
ncbi:2,4-dienoyl-CoA reductase-like NADH-dependent reductase (Old Yellow Enzyme family) [Arthrobacter sp. AG1021]|uniref:NADH:flavin oxidoreductase n=1 Tax=Arthrobacter sp. AG1021 TaxID=2183908 RepID=UPI000EABFD14|nr:NADH:flavin oxidoreductase [Arthrobacter sp. AG1021]RKS16871.1 2,4-dienoyl-CoA reductase-like NADH-dependent reductase (Old Yellow Enzyme family) [Arthrobacter sp. AG1021]